MEQVRKNSDNTYSGVVLGEVNKMLSSKKDNEGNWTVAENTSQIGILGFDRGLQTFGFKK